MQVGAGWERDGRQIASLGVLLQASLLSAELGHGSTGTRAEGDSWKGVGSSHMFQLQDVVLRNLKMLLYLT